MVWYPPPRVPRPKKKQETIDMRRSVRANESVAIGLVQGSRIECNHGAEATLFIPDLVVNHVRRDISLIDGLKNHNPLKGFGTSIITLAKDHKCQQFGKSDEDEALIRQWIEYTACYVNYSDVRTTAIQVLKELNTVLATRSYFVGNTQTLADIVIYYSLYNVMGKRHKTNKDDLAHLILVPFDWAGSRLHETRALNSTLHHAAY
uniref:Nuclear-export cofactor Arc1-like N-terminal domain-containing protein n=1 Tax=Timema tahoe TaxID=61484 RepID=A0A7R9FMH7_9NEOP|nr:unnamed protein product [Timema tahoe]